MLQQREHQLPAAPTPLGMTCRVGNTSITYDHDCITKVVRWQGFANDDEQLLQHVYDVLWHLPNGAGLQHPRGLLKPIAPPRLSDGRWRAEFPLCTACNPVTLPRLRMMVADVLHGLQALHQHNIVHRDVRPPNILEVRLALGNSMHVCWRGAFQCWKGWGLTVMGADLSWGLLLQYMHPLLPVLKLETCQYCTSSQQILR